MSAFGYGMTVVIAPLCSYFLVFVLFVANLLSQKTALAYFRLTAFGMVVAGILLMFFTIIR
jgi:hypothetical protein